MYLLQDTTNTVVLTLTEETTITADTVYYLFELFSPATKQSIYFTAPDTSTNTIRYNRFNITLTGGTQDLTGGTVTIVPNGRWNFNVYQMSGQTNLSLTGVTGGPVESGYVQVTGTTSSRLAASYTGASYQYNYYTP